MVTSVADKDIFNEITDGKREIDMGLLMKKALIVSGDALTQILKDEQLNESFLELSDRVDVVLACRVSPKQKADIVHMVRLRFP